MARAGAEECPRELPAPREALALVCRMMRYRVDALLGLEDELSRLVQTLYSPRDGEGTREKVRRLQELADRIARHLDDMEYDAVRIAVYLEATVPGGDEGRGEVPYIA